MYLNNVYFAQRKQVHLAMFTNVQIHLDIFMITLYLQTANLTASFYTNTLRTVLSDKTRSAPLVQTT